MISQEYSLAISETLDILDHTKKEDVDDLISIGTIGLIKGIDSYSNKHGTRITTYCASVRCDLLYGKA